MRIIGWAAKILVFVAIAALAVKNVEPVTVRAYLGYEWRAPLVVVLLGTFAAGAALGLLAGLPRVLRQRREIAALRRELAARQEAAGAPRDAL
jgi:uncharacterized integral membrane protein